MIEELGLSDAKPTKAPVIVDTRLDPAVEYPAVDDEAVGRFRRHAAKMNYSAMDRADDRFGTMLLTSAAPQPKMSDQARLEHLVRFVRGRSFLWTVTPGGKRGNMTTAYTDADWGCFVRRGDM